MEALFPLYIATAIFGVGVTVIDMIGILSGSSEEDSSDSEGEEGDDASDDSAEDSDFSDQEAQGSEEESGSSEDESEEIGASEKGSMIMIFPTKNTPVLASYS